MEMDCWSNCSDCDTLFYLYLNIFKNLYGLKTTFLASSGICPGSLDL